MKTATHKEGATPLSDYSGLKSSWVETQEELNAVEAANIQKAIRKYLGTRKRNLLTWFSVKNINQLHKEMFGEVWTWAGKYRTTQKSVHLTPFLIPVEMYKLSQDLEFWCANQWKPVEVAARLHHRLVWIHPYENGNGRHARLMGDIVLYTNGHPIPLWPDKFHQTGANHERREYIAALQEADRGNYIPLTALYGKY
ncbi:MAG: hypothetical protein K940chlam9_00905 [Chlamydiae bacterium]|nr:hypothetical protein [Chlamydiota bacterium]